MKLEVVMLPVSDADVAKEFYERLGFAVDVDVEPGPGVRVVQATPPGSACSVVFGVGIGEAEPGSVRGLHLVVTDVIVARDRLTERGVEVGEVRHMVQGEWVAGPHPDREDYNSFADLVDPDGNTWVLQEVGHTG